MTSKQQIKHIGIILDGNRRWAKKRGLPTLLGHKRGYEIMNKAAKWCARRGVGILTVYAFSSENWNRSEQEVNYLMDLFRQALGEKNIEKINQESIRIKIIGQIKRLPKDIQQLAAEAERKTKNNKRMIFNIGISYGGRPDIVEAVKKIINKKIPAKKITEDLINKNLWTQGQPDPDIIIRTSGEQRLSNFLTWQSAYSELFFIKKNWPEFTEQDLDEVISEYNQRGRRFGQ
ncbi:MAG: polyprenyl diphosphate synthase [Candidatus Buchananbacteria bacterium]